MPGRIQRGAPPKGVLRKSSLDRAKPELRRDFKDRCAYSMQHLNRAGGLSCLEIDHFDPRRKQDKIQHYSNLFLSTRHCNNAKRDVWPTKAEFRNGVGFIDCCEEADYGVHIFEDPQTHELVGVTPKGRYQIRVCDLNAGHLTAERRRRAAIWARLRESGLVQVSLIEPASEVIRLLREEAEEMIPEIAAVPQAAPPRRH